MMGFGVLRIAAMLRRVAKALEESNRLAQERLDREFPQHERTIRKFEFSRPTVEQWNQKRGGNQS